VLATRSRVVLFLVLLPVWALFPPALLAVDGVIEINASRVQAGGVTPGDAPGYPVTINQSGSYRLTGNLGVSNELVTAIEIMVNDVTLDLNGFTIFGPNVCTSAAGSTTCALSGSGYGINAVNRTRITIANGTVRGMGALGISSGAGCRLENLHVANNGATGIFFGSSCVVRRCTVSLNGANGIEGGAVSRVAENVVHQNAGDGIDLAFGASIEGNSVFDNDVAGIRAVPPGVILVQRTESFGTSYHSATRCCMKVWMASTISFRVPEKGVRSQRPW
jgi:parallel beta-helix repeat protein